MFANVGTLEGQTLCGYEVICMDTLREKFPERFNESGSMDYNWFEAEIRPNYHIYIRNDVNSVAFTMQKSAPTKDQGCSIASMILAAKLMLEQYHIQYPSRETAVATTKLDEALLWLGKPKNY